MKKQLNFKFFINLIIGFLLLLFFSCKTKQITKKENEVNYIPYYLEVYKADSLQIIGKNKEAFEKLDSLFKIYKPLNQIFLYEMSNYVRLAQLENRSENVKPIIKSLIQEWNLSVDNIKWDSLMLLKIKTLKISDNELMNWQENNIRNKTCSDTITKMFSEDQMSRGKPNEWEIDEKNYTKFKLLVSKFGYPETKKIGIENTINLSVMFFHMSRIDEYNELKGILYQNLKDGKASTFEIRNLIEAKYLLFYQHYYFGDVDSAVGFKIIKSNKPKDTFNLRRKKYGLPSLEYEIWKKKLNK